MKERRRSGVVVEESVERTGARTLRRSLLCCDYMMCVIEISRCSVVDKFKKQAHASFISNASRERQAIATSSLALSSVLELKRYRKQLEVLMFHFDLFFA